MAEQNSGDWIDEQIAARGLEGTAQDRRALLTEYLETRPYSLEGGAGTTTTKQSTSTQKNTSQSTTATPAGSQTVEEELKNIDQSLISGSVGPFANTNYVFPSRKINYNNQNVAMASKGTRGGVNSVRTPGGVISYYDGDYLVNENGDLERGQYDANGGDILSEYASVTDPVQRNALFSTLRDYGFYGESKPSELALSGRGLTSTDERAMQLFLNYSSGEGRTWRAMMPLIQGQAKLVTSGTGRSVSVVSTEDATRAFREESLRILGRMPTQQEIRAAVGAIQAKERSRGAGGGMDAPTLTTAAQEQAKATAPGERAAQSAGQAINQIFALLGGR